MRIAKSYKHYKHIDARNARVLMNECNQSAAEMVVYYYEAYTMKLSKLDYSFESIDLIEEYIDCIKLAKLNEDDLRYRLQDIGYYLGQIIKRKIGGCWLEHFYPATSPTHDLFSEYYLLPNRKQINLEEQVVKFYERGARFSLKIFMGEILREGGW